MLTDEYIEHVGSEVFNSQYKMHLSNELTVSRCGMINIRQALEPDVVRFISVRQHSKSQII